MENESELNALKRKLKEKDEELALSAITQSEELELSRNKLRKYEIVLSKLKDHIECPVCMEVPRSGPIPVCPNGHFVCSKCKADSCPTCRAVMGPGKSLLAVTVLENVGHPCKFISCNETLALEDVKQHEMVCEHRTVQCPWNNCVEEVSLSNLVGHLISSKCCLEEKGPISVLDNWRCVDYHMGKDITLRNLGWPLHLYDFFGEKFAVFPSRSDGLYYFVLVMLASKIKCMEYRFEMIVHEGVSHLESEMGVRFHGCPISIDEVKDELKLYGTTEHFMARILKESTSKSNFGLSFKVFKK